MGCNKDHIFYLYKTSAYREGAPMIDEINFYLKRRTWPAEYIKYGPDDGMESFDIQEYKQRLTEYIPDSITYSAYEETSFGKGVLTVNSDIDNAVTLLKYVRFFAGINELVVYDPQTNHCYYHTDRDLDEYVIAETRAKELISQIEKSNKHYIVTKIGDERRINSTVLSYSVTLSKTILNDFEREVGKFDELLNSLLIAGDELSYINDCFTINNHHLAIQFVFEGYDSAQYIGGINEGKVVVKKLNRMGCYDASKTDFISDEEIFGLMKAEELQGKYPNPGDRYAFICKTQEYLKTKLPCVEYAPYPIYGGKIVLYRAVSEYNIRKYRSEVEAYLMIDSYYFDVIISCFEKFYPHLSSRISDDNYIPDLTTKDIIEEIKNTKRLITSKPDSDEVKNLFKEAYVSPEEYNNKEYLTMLFGTMDFLCEWLETNMVAGDDYLIYITS